MDVCAELSVGNEDRGLLDGLVIDNDFTNRPQLGMHTALPGIEAFECEFDAGKAAECHVDSANGIWDQRLAIRASCNPLSTGRFELGLQATGVTRSITGRRQRTAFKDPRGWTIGLNSRSALDQDVRTVPLRHNGLGGVGVGLSLF